MKIKVFVEEMSASENALVARLLEKSFLMRRLIEKDQTLRGEINVEMLAGVTIKPEEFLQQLKIMLDGLAKKSVKTIDHTKK